MSIIEQEVIERKVKSMGRIIAFAAVAVVAVGGFIAFMKRRK